MENKAVYKKAHYTELSNAEITENRNIVISECSKGGFTVAQQLKADGTKVFMKGALHIDNLDGLYNLRNALNVAIDKVAEEGDKEMWAD
jgi:hypothetical protein